jgi:hypothetical protein
MHELNSKDFIRKLDLYYVLNPRKPKLAVHSQNPGAVKKFLHEEYPAVKQLASDCGAKIHWTTENPSVPTVTVEPLGRKRRDADTQDKRNTILRQRDFSDMQDWRNVFYGSLKRAVYRPCFHDFLKRLLFGQEQPIFLIYERFMHKNHSSHQSQVLIISVPQVSILYFGNHFFIISLMTR